MAQKRRRPSNDGAACRATCRSPSPRRAFDRKIATRTLEKYKPPPRPRRRPHNYVAVLAKGDSQEKAFGYAYAAIAAAALKAGLVNAGEVGMGKAPFFVWGAIASYIAYAAINE